MKFQKQKFEFPLNISSQPSFIESLLYEYFSDGIHARQLDLTYMQETFGLLQERHYKQLELMVEGKSFSGTIKLNKETNVNKTAQLSNYKAPSSLVNQTREFEKYTLEGRKNDLIHHFTIWSFLERPQ